LEKWGLGVSESILYLYRESDYDFFSSDWGKALPLIGSTALICMLNFFICILPNDPPFVFDTMSLHLYPLGVRSWMNFFHVFGENAIGMVVGMLPLDGGHLLPFISKVGSALLGNMMGVRPLRWMSMRYHYGATVPQKMKSVF